jgi:hypothetical protein
MNSNVSPFIAQIVARLLLVGIIFFHWEASYVLILYFRYDAVDGGSLRAGQERRRERRRNGRPDQAK